MLPEIRRFVDDEVLPNVAEWDQRDELPDAVMQRLLDLGVFGALVPEEFGGRGMEVRDLVPVWRTLSQGWISLTGAVNPSGLATTLLVRHGSDAQRARWLPGLAAGELTASFSITEPQAGSDLKQIETTATPLDGGGFRLDGEKRWVAGGVSSDVIFMLVDGPSCLVLPAAGRGGEGWSVEELGKIGYRGVESAAYAFAGLEAPEAEILGDVPGMGAKQMLDALDVGRINVACRALGIIDRALLIALREAGEREVGGALLGEHTHTQLRIGEVRARLLAVEALIDRAAEAVDQRREDARDVAIAAKLVASDTAVWVVDVVARLAASRSYAADDELGRLRRDAPQTQIGEGANDALLLALGRGAIR